MTPGKILYPQNLCPKVFDFCKSLKMRETLLVNPLSYVCYCFLLYKEKMLSGLATVES